MPIQQLGINIPSALIAPDQSPRLMPIYEQSLGDKGLEKKIAARSGIKNVITYCQLNQKPYAPWRHKNSEKQQIVKTQRATN